MLRWDDMKVGDRVKLRNGVDRHASGTISYAYPGGGGAYYFRVKLDSGKTVERVAPGLILLKSETAYRDLGYDKSLP